jgi:hypothetical protein
LGIVLESADGYSIGLYALIDARTSATPLECLLCQGGLGVLSLRASLNGADVTGFTAEGGWEPASDISLIGQATDVGVYAYGSIGPVTVLGDIAGDVIARSGSIGQVLTVDGDVAASVLAPDGTVASVVAYMGDIDLRGDKQIHARGTVNAIHAIAANWSGGSIHGDLGSGAPDISIDYGSLWSLQAIGGSIEGLRVGVASGQVGTVAASGGRIKGSSFTCRGLTHLFTTGSLEDTDIDVRGGGTLSRVTVLGDMRRSNISAGNLGVVQVANLGSSSGAVEYQIGEQASDGWWLRVGWTWEHVYGEKSYLDTARL